jgi:hypothetical protein
LALRQGVRFAFRKKPAPRWIDSADLNWVPEEPLAFGPGVAADFLRARFFLR